jgi:hypothetical protein
MAGIPPRMRLNGPAPALRCKMSPRACTRARDHLLVTSVDPASEFLDDLRAQSHEV